MHGKGKYTYSTGKVYDGMWAEDRPVSGAAPPPSARNGWLR